MPQLPNAARPIAYAAAVAVSTWGIISAVGGADAQPAGNFVTLTGANDSLDGLRWKSRPVIVLADDPADPAYKIQMTNLKSAASELKDRDIVVLSEADGSASGLRDALGNPNGFRVVLVGKDGGIKVNQDSPLGVSELFSTIDAMPMRKREMKG